MIRFLMEKLKTRYDSICRLEADCGQPDHTPPGVLSLSLRESVSSRVKLVSQRFLGFVNPSTDPFLYVKVVSQLYDDYRRGFCNSPLFVNMHGWSTGTGIETWAAVLLTIQPDFVVYLGDDENEFEITSRNSFISADLPVPSSEWIRLSGIITIDEVANLPNRSQEIAGDQRWKKFASHFRPDLAFKDEYKSCHPSEFFRYPFVRLITLNISDTHISFPGNCGEVIPIDPLRAVVSRIVGLSNSESSQLICLGFVVAFDLTTISIVIPPNISETYGQAINSIVRGEMNWSPRDRVCHNGRVTSTDFLPIGGDPSGLPYFLPHSLKDEGSGAAKASSRTNLRRKRLIRPPRN